MKIQIGRLNDTIYTNKDYSNINDRGEIAHFLIELEIIKLELMEMWEEYTEEIEDISE